MDKKPFSNTTIKEFKGRKFDCTAIRINLTPKLQSRLIASPNLNSKFSPSLTIKKSPMMSKRITLDSNVNGDNKKFGGGNNTFVERKNFLMKFAGTNANNSTNSNSNGLDTRGLGKKSATVVQKADANNNYEKDFVGNQNQTAKYNKSNTIDHDANNTDEEGVSKSIRVNRKKRNDLKNLGEAANDTARSKFSTMYESDDLPIVPGVNYQAIKSSDRLEALKYILF